MPIVPFTGPYFYPRPPRGGRPAVRDRPGGIRGNFYPRPPRGGRHRAVVRDHECRGFLSTPSARRATYVTLQLRSFATYFYPRPPRGGRRCRQSCCQSTPAISIHALREEGDLYDKVSGMGLQFLSTPSARRATGMVAASFDRNSISIHALREEGDEGCNTHQLCNPISIHALREEGDPWLTSSTSSRRISIHALREEGDLAANYVQASTYKFLSTPSARRATVKLRKTWYSPFDFYPRPPRGGRLNFRCLVLAIGQFLSTPSARRATKDDGLYVPTPEISIHALREEGDTRAACIPTPTKNFYPRPPRGGRQQKQRQNLYFQTNYTTFCTNLEEP